MPVHFTKRKGKVIGMNMTFAEMRFTYFALTGKKLPNDEFQECGKFLMENFSEQQLREAVEKFDLQQYLNDPSYVG